MSGNAKGDGTEGLLHRWRSARAAARGLPAYEDLVLGNLGRLASRSALVGGPAAHPRLLWVGEAFEGWLGLEGAGLALDGLPGGLAQSLREIVGDALAAGEPVRAPCARVAGGVAYTTGMLALPSRREPASAWCSCASRARRRGRTSSRRCSARPGRAWWRWRPCAVRVARWRISGSSPSTPPRPRCCAPPSRRRSGSA